MPKNGKKIREIEQGNVDLIVAALTDKWRTVNGQKHAGKGKNKMQKLFQNANCE